MIGFVSLLRSSGFSEEKFPFEECSFEDEREHGIKNSHTKYWVVVQYAEDENRFEVHLCTPYLYQESDESEAYGGWQCVGSSDFFRHPAENWSENEDAVPVCFRLAE